MKLLKTISIVAGSALVALGLLTKADAAVITWQPSVDMYHGNPTDESFVNTSGTLAAAVNCSSAVGNDPTVNGVPFVNALNNVTVTGAGGQTIKLAAGFANGSAFLAGQFTPVNITTLLSSAVYNVTNVFLGGLTPGVKYQIQIFCNDARSSRSTNYYVAFDGVNTAPKGTCVLNNAYPAAVSVGDSITAIFTADSTTQSFPVFGANNGGTPTQGGGQAQINAIQLRVITELIWRGQADGNWDAITTNWVDAATGTNNQVFINNAAVTFNDIATNFTVNISGTVQPSSITMSNVINNYTFSGGTIGGAGGLTNSGPGTLTLSSVDLTYTGATAIKGGTLAIASAANNTLTSISGSGALTKSGGGTLTFASANSFSGTATVAGGTLAIGNNASGNARYQVTAGTLAITKVTSGVTLTNSSLTFGAGTTGLSINDGAVSSLVPVIRAPNLTNAGTVTVTYTATAILPGPTTLISYDAATSVLGSYTLAPLPVGYTGVIVTNVANSSIDLVITGTPSKVWVGGDINYPNGWYVGAYTNWTGATVFADGDYVSFLDGASYPSIDVGTVVPVLMVVSNSATTYTFNGGGITTSMLVKDGNGTVSLANFGNSFTNINLLAGTLSYDGSVTEAASFTGGGTLQVGGSGTFLTLSGNNSGFNGPISVTAGNTLKLGANNVLGSTNGATTIASGATLDINAKKNQGKEVIVSGAGPNAYNGAIINSSTTQQNALDQVTLAGNATFGGTGRWDIRAVSPNKAVLKALGAYTLTKVAANFISLVDVDVDPLLGDINILEGTLQVALTTSTNQSLGNVNNTINLSAATTLDLYSGTVGLVPAWNKKIALLGNATIVASSSLPASLVGPVDLSNFTLTLNGSASSLVFSNALSSSGGGVVKIGANAVSLLGANTYSGSTTVSNGNLTISTASTGSSGYTVYAAATLGARRHSAGGTLNMTSLALGTTGAGAVTLLFDLATYGGSPTVPVMDVSSGTLATNAATYNVTVLSDLNGLVVGKVSLFKYAPGTFTNVISVVSLPAGVVGTVTNNTAASQVELNIVSVARTLNWVGNLGNDWNINSPANWTETNTTAPTVYKEVGVGDNVVFNSAASNYTVNVAATVSPSTMQITGTNNYTIGGASSIAGSVQVRVGVAATSTVTLTGNNTYTGGTFFNGGTTIVGSDAALGDPAGLMRWNGGAVRYTGSATNTRPVSVEGGAPSIIVDTNQIVQLGGSLATTSVALIKTGPGSLTLTGNGNLRLQVDQGTATLSGNANITNGTLFQNISSTNGTVKLIVKDNAKLTSMGLLDIADGSGQTNATILGELYVSDSAMLALSNLYVGKWLTATGRVYQTGGLVTNNGTAGNWWLGGNTIGVDTNTFGGYYLSGGTLAIPGRDLQVGRLGGGELVVSGSGTLTAANLNVGTENTANGVLTVNGGAVTLSANLNVPLRGKSGTAVITNGGTLTAAALVLGSTNQSNSGSVTIGSGGTLVVGKVSGLATTTAISFNGGTLKANANSATYLEGLTNATIASGGLTVDTAANNIAINQNLTGSGGLAKAGAGTLTLNSQSYTGDTVVNVGTLASITDVGGTVLQGNLIVNAGGTLSPGGSSLGTIYAGNGKSVTLGGTNALQIAKSGLSFLNDKVLADINVTEGGNLVVTFDSTHTTAVAVGNTFTFFTLGGSLLGSFATVNLPTTDPVNGNLLTWNTNLLATAGSISVASSMPPVTLSPPPTLTNVVAGGQLQLSWGAGYMGYTLQMQTNLLNTNWVNVAGSQFVTATNLLVNPSIPALFYRLRY